MKLYLHGLYTEAHRTAPRIVQLLAAFVEAGVTVAPRLDSNCDWAVCGTTEDWREFRAVVGRVTARRRRVRTAHYCWDLYPALVRGWTGHTTEYREMWRGYVHELKAADRVLVPNAGTAARVREFCGRGATVVHSCCDPWYKDWPAGEVSDGGYVLNVVRNYPWDKNWGLIGPACEKAGLPLRELNGRAGWDEFRSLVANASVLVCPYHEASTGGLALVEGYALGKKVVVPASDLNGAGEYLPDGRCFVFASGDPDDLRIALSEVVKFEVHPFDLPDRRKFVDDTYSDAAFARRLAGVLGG